MKIKQWGINDDCDMFVSILVLGGRYTSKAQTPDMY